MEAPKGLKNKSMNVIQLVSNKVWGGGERYAFDLTARLLREGADVRGVTRGAEVVDTQFNRLEIPLRYAPFKGFIDFKTPRVIARLVREFPGNDYVIIHAHDFKNALLAVRAKRMLKGLRDVKVVVTRHLIKPAKSDFLNSYIYRNINALIFISDIVRKEFLSSKPAIDSSKLYTVYNSIFSPPIPDFIGRIPANEQNDSTVKLLFMGRISREKGIELLLNALSLVKSRNWFLRIGGTGDNDYVESLKNMADKLGLSDRIEWIGYVTDIWKEIDKADVGLMPSVWREPFGLTILEFISQGIPMVTTNHGAQREILTNGVDSLLSRPDPPDFARALDRIISDPDLRMRLGKTALTAFRRFDYETFFSKIIAIYRNC